jgi:hypothetical protein
VLLSSENVHTWDHFLDQAYQLLELDRHVTPIVAVNLEYTYAGSSSAFPPVGREITRVSQLVARPEARIQVEVARFDGPDEVRPALGPETPVTSLLDEFRHNTRLQKQLGDLIRRGRYNGWRPVRGDGNW